ncbi:cal-1, partial [Symbiodinium sp. KB8]
VAVLRCRFFRLFVNWIDLFVAILSVSASFIAGLDEGFNVWALRMLRLAKVARALRLMRMRRALESLSLLLRCVQSSLQVLFWSLGLLGVIQCIAGMVIGQLLMPYMRNESVDVVRRAEVYKYFGTFNRTLLTMFEVLFANWAIPARVCIENVSEGFIYIFIFYRCLVGFAVLNVATGTRNK